jgi:hypothetical protein
MPSESPRESAYATYHGEVTDAPKAYRAPDTEAPGTHFKPYLGTDYHGVLPVGKTPPVIPSDVEGGKVVTGFFEPPEVDTIAPIPVRIVSEAPHEYSQWRAYQSVATDTPAMVVNRKEGRQRVTIRNISTADRIFIGPDNNVNPLSGYPLNGGDDVSLIGEAEVWAVRNTGVVNPVPIAVLLEFSTAQR